MLFLTPHFLKTNRSFFQGIAGLACAFTLGQSGHKVHVLEKSPELHQVCRIFTLATYAPQTLYSARAASVFPLTLAKSYLNGGSKRSSQRQGAAVRVLSIHVSHSSPLTLFGVPCVPACKHFRAVDRVVCPSTSFAIIRTPHSANTRTT